jgi:pectate lyase
MKSSFLQVGVILRLALVVAATPAVSERDCDLGLAVDTAASNFTSKTLPVSVISTASATNKRSSATRSTNTSTVKSSSTKATKSSSVSTTSRAITTGGAFGSSSFPVSSGTAVLSAAQTIEAGGSLDGGIVIYDRGVSCTGQTEGDESDAVFQIENGGSLSNVIVGPNQIEGVHCQGACTLTNVWWSTVCEHAFSIKSQDADETTTINGGGAFGASDKVVQHNGAGTVSISDFTVSDFGKLYWSCENCDSMFERHVIIDGVTASDGSEIAGMFPFLPSYDVFLNLIRYQLEL